MRRSTPRSPMHAAAALTTGSDKRSDWPPPEFRREGSDMSNDLNKSGLSRRDLLANAAAATGALFVGFWMPPRAAAQGLKPEGAPWAVEPSVKEVNAWVVVAPD